MSTLAAAVQMCSGPDLAHNLARAADLVRVAAERGATLIVLPENFAFMSASEEKRRAVAETIDPDEKGASRGPVITAMAEAAKSARATLILGGMPERVTASGPQSVAGKVHNTCVVIGPDGAVLDVYRKIHLFDVRIPDGSTYEESKTVAPGDRPVVSATPAGPIGLSVCYDLRFPELYRKLAQQGARVLVVPAAFTLHTGRDHWHVLLRARAVENLCYVVAAAQCGRHVDAPSPAAPSPAPRLTFGHSLIVDPWGTVLSEAPDGEGVAVAELSFDRQDRLRRELPALDHRKL